MLLEKPIAKNDVVSLKLNSGEELIGSYQDENETQYTIDKPVCLVPVEQGISFAPFMMTTESTKFSINKNSVVSMARTAEQLAKNYTEQTTSIKLA